LKPAYVLLIRTLHMDNQQINQQINQALASAPKQYCDSIRIIQSEEAFLLAMFSGGNASVFVLSPGHLKKFSQMVANNIDKYEKQYGPIKAQWNPNVPSPFSPDDLKNPPKDGQSNKK
jgi:hypothetical protein